MTDMTDTWSSQKTITEDTFEMQEGKTACMQNTHTHAPATNSQSKANGYIQKHQGCEQMATCTQLCVVDETPPMNSVGFRADSKRLRISAPSMSFSPEDCLV